MENTPNNTNTPVSGQTSAKKNTGLIVLTAIFGLTAVILAVLLVLKNDKGGDTVADNSDAKCVVTQEQIDNPEEGSVAEVVANYDSDKEIRDLIKKLSKKYIDNGLDRLETTFDSGYVLTELDVDNAYATTGKSYGISFSYSWNDGNSKALFDIASNFLTEQGFKYDEALRTYDKDTYRCVVFDGAPFHLSCADKTWISEGNKELAEKLATAYYKKTGSSEAIGLIVDKDNLKMSDDGEIEYFKGSTGVYWGGGGYIFFYRLTSGDEWTYVTSGNGIPDCSDFDENAKKVFGDFGCQDGFNTRKVGE